MLLCIFEFTDVVVNYTFCRNKNKKKKKSQRIHSKVTEKNRKSVYTFTF